MGRRVALTTIVLSSAISLAAPVPPVPDAKALVAGLNAESPKARDQASAALRGRPDATPWLRRAARSPDGDTAKRAAELLAPHDRKRLAGAKLALDACIREGRADLFIEWHHFWQPESKDELWPVGPRAGKLGLDEFAKRHPVGKNPLEEGIAWLLASGERDRFHDGPLANRPNDSGLWRLRTDRLEEINPEIAFASIAGPISMYDLKPGYFFAFGPVVARRFDRSVLICDDGLSGRPDLASRLVGGVSAISSFTACRGNAAIPTSRILGSILLVDGDIDLSQCSDLKDSVIRASGEIRLPKGFKPENCTIEARAKDATAPYKFFELSEVGLSLADDEEGLVVTGVKADTPFGNCGLAKGDLIRAIDDAPAGHSEEFRKKVRRALVRQGDCLVTVTRGDKTLDLPVFFPLPK